MWTRWERPRPTRATCLAHRCLIHFTPCSCGSTMSGHRAHDVTTEAFSTLCKRWARRRRGPERPRTTGELRRGLRGTAPRIAYPLSYLSKPRESDRSRSGAGASRLRAEMRSAGKPSFCHWAIDASFAKMLSGSIPVVNGMPRCLMSPRGQDQARRQVWRPSLLGSSYGRHRPARCQNSETSLSDSAPALSPMLLWEHAQLWLPARDQSTRCSRAGRGTKRRRARCIRRRPKRASNRR